MTNGVCSAACPDSLMAAQVDSQTAAPDLGESGRIEAQGPARSLSATSFSAMSLPATTRPAAGTVAETASLRATDRSLFLSAVAGAVGTAVIAISAFGYHRLDSRIGTLQQALDESVHAQNEANKKVDALRAQQQSQAGQLHATQQQLDAHPAPAKVATQAEPSVFTVYAGEWLGSAFVVTSTKGHSDLLTNYHVVAAEYVTGNRDVEIRHNDTTYDGRIVDVSQADDLAVIRVNHDLPSLSLVTKRARVGDPVLVLGSPNDLGGTVTSGIVSAYRELDEADYLQFSAPISPGSSGGPVLNETGQVLGVAVMKDVRDQTEGISYAIPIERVCESLAVC